MAILWIVTETIFEQWLEKMLKAGGLCIILLGDILLLTKMDTLSSGMDPHSWNRLF